jgi:hypothetical protein
MITTRRRSARRIKPIRGRHYRWKVPLFKNSKMIHCESRLERFYVRLLDFDREVESVESQPICILYSYKGREKEYYPDFKVKTLDGRIRIVEVKPKKMTQLPENIVKFIIGRLFCESQGWEYQVVTEDEIFPGVLQDNIDILRAFGFEATSHNDLMYVFNMVHNTGAITIDMLRENCRKIDESTFFKCLYKLIYYQKIYADLISNRLEEQSIVSIHYGKGEK